jgi:hypothetical protein
MIAAGTTPLLALATDALRRITTLPRSSVITTPPFSPEDTTCYDGVKTLASMTRHTARPRHEAH